ncbi:MAG: response regulator, partial [Verrucomicrobia bacterium]|nr:response regulator [Verrucomicrobiota bacterium]
VTFNAFLRDLTEKKKLEAQFLRAQRLESIGTLAGGIAHDLNNVLAPIMMVVQTLKRKLPDEQSQQMLGMLSSSVQRGADIVRQVLSFARGVEEKRVEVQIKHVILEIEKFLQETFPKSIEIGRRVPANLWAVTADVTQLHQVFMNLCVNARDAMPNGGRLTLGAENLLLDETSARGHPDAKPGEYVVITVTDTGTGIPPDIINKMFEPFFTTKDFGKGTGIGLSTVAGIVKNHGGFVSVESETGKGSRFKVHLPKSGAPIKTAPPVEDSEFPAGHGELILLADDEAAIREITRGTLESYGYRVITVNDGAEAVARYVEHQKEIQLVLTDMMMPFMDGAATIRALRKMNRSLKIIACGGLMDESCDLSEREIAGVNVHAFLRKPFTAEKLLRSVNHVIRMGPF